MKSKTLKESVLRFVNHAPWNSLQVLLGISFLFLVALIFSHRWIFHYSVDTQYLNDYYWFSQWTVPFSSRIMGDASLYEYSGFQLIQSFEPFAINPEVPPLAKLLYGLSIHLTENPLLVVFMFYLLTIGLVSLFLQTHTDFSNKKKVLTTLLVASSPLLIENLDSALLDLPLMFFFFLHIYFLFLIPKGKTIIHKFIFSCLTGISLGFMAATKIPLYLPLIVAVDLFYLFRKKQLLFAAPFLFLVPATYMATYFPYILKNGVLQWISSQKWMLSFYLDSQVVAIPGMVFITSFTGFYQGWFGTGWERLKAWDGSWGLWIVSVFVLISSLQPVASRLGSKVSQRQRFKVRTHAIENEYFILLCVFFLAFFAVIPFWGRYLLLLLPVFWIVTVRFMSALKVSSWLLFFPVLSIFTLFFNSFWYQPQPHFYELWDKAAYSEVYSFFSTEHKNQIARTAFVEEQHSHIDTLLAYDKNTEVVERSFNPLSGTGSELLRQNLVGLTGEQFTELKLVWSREYGQWRVQEIQTLSVEFIPRQEESLVTICVNPVKVTDWGTTYRVVREMSGSKSLFAPDKVMRFVPRDYCIPVQELHTYPTIPKEYASYGIFELTTADSIPPIIH